MLKIISVKICPFVQRVIATFEASQIPYDIEYISLKDKPRWFTEVSPHAQVPLVIVENGTVLFESDAIIEYIEDEYGPLEQDVPNEQRALNRAWSYLASKNYLIQCGTMASKDRATFEQREKTLRSAFEKIEKQLSGRSIFFRTDVLSNVDIAWLPLLHRSSIIKEHSGYDFLWGLPKTRAWQKSILKTKLADKSVSSDYVEKFTDYYLTDTYLATGKDNQAVCGSGHCCH